MCYLVQRKIPSLAERDLLPRKGSPATEGISCQGSSKQKTSEGVPVVLPDSDSR
jgi:hypothetical protein